MEARKRQRKLEILEELHQCTREAACKASQNVNETSFNALNLLVCAIDERIEYVENCD